MYGFTLHTESSKVGWLVASVRSLLSLCPTDCWHKVNRTCYAERGRYGMLQGREKSTLEQLLKWIKALRNPYLRLWTSGDFPDSLEDSMEIARAIPRRVIAWGYTHRSPALVDSLNSIKDNLAVSYSVESVSAAIEHSKARPTIISIGQESFWQGHRSRTIDGTLFVRCPANYRDKFQCQDCGGGLPLCARKNRNYVIGLDLHGIHITDLKRSQLNDTNWGSGYIPVPTTT